IEVEPLSSSARAPAAAGAASARAAISETMTVRVPRRTCLLLFDGSLRAGNLRRRSLPGAGACQCRALRLSKREQNVFTWRRTCERFQQVLKSVTGALAPAISLTGWLTHVSGIASRAPSPEIGRASC